MEDLPHFSHAAVKTEQFVTFEINPSIVTAVTFYCKRSQSHNQQNNRVHSTTCID